MRAKPKGIENIVRGFLELKLKNESSQRQRQTWHKKLDVFTWHGMGDRHFDSKHSDQICSLTPVGHDNIRNLAEYMIQRFALFFLYSHSSCNGTGCLHRVVYAILEFYL